MKARFCWEVSIYLLIRDVYNVGDYKSKELLGRFTIGLGGDAYAEVPKEKRSFLEGRESRPDPGQRERETSSRATT